MSRPTAAKRGYDRRWRRAREAFLVRHPLCASCQTQGRTAPATVVDHIVPHRGGRRLFWDRKNWQPLCAHCHDGAKKREEARGYSNAMGLDGWPVDPGHPTNEGGAGGTRGVRGGVKLSLCCL